MGKLLLFDNGKGNPAIVFWWVCYIVLAVVFGGGFFWMSGRAGGSGYLGGVFFSMDSYWFGAGILIFMICIAYGVLFHLSISKTEIRIYENIIEGRSTSKYMLWGDCRTFGFQLALDQITNVESVKNAVIIHVSNTKYKCYVQDAGYIQRVINQLRYSRKRQPGIPVKRQASLNR